MSADLPARFYRPRFLPGVELVSVAYNNRRFPEHSHEEYVIGVIQTGAEALTVGRQRHIADAGTVILLNPAEPHSNTTIGTETLRYSVLYIPKSTFTSLKDATKVLPQFGLPISKRRDLFKIVSAVHAELAHADTDKLGQESALSALIGLLGSQSCSVNSVPHNSSMAAKKVKQFIHEHYTSAFGLGDLGRLTGLSIFHTTRTFKKEYGLSPFAYRDHLRMIEARRRLLDGQPISQIGLMLGYADQSHFTRQFQRIVGISPQRYARGTIG